MKPLKVGTKVEYSQSKATKGPWKIEYHYGNNVYRIGTDTEFCDKVPRSMLTVAKKSEPKSKKTPVKKKWHRVKVPYPWKAAEGETLEGVYISKTEKQGDYGPYTVYYIRTAKDNVVYVSGAMASNLFNVIPFNTKIMLVFLGYKVCAGNTDLKYKDYQLFTETPVIV